MRRICELLCVLVMLSPFVALQRVQAQPQLPVPQFQPLLRPNVNLGNREARNEMMARQFRSMLGSAKASAKTRLQVRIDDINRACELSEAQVKKLGIASKGAVIAMTDQMKKVYVEQAARVGFKFDPDAEPEAAAADGNADVLQPINFAVPVSQNNPLGSEIEKERIWVNTLKKVLSEEQSKKWNAWQESRVAFEREAAVRNFVVSADRALLLSPKQREALIQYVDTNYGEKLGIQSGLMFGPFVGGFGARNPVGETEPDHELASVLSESQLESWTQTFQVRLDRLAVGARGPGGWAVNVAPGLPPAFNVPFAAPALPLAVPEAADEDNDDDN